MYIDSNPISKQNPGLPREVRRLYLFPVLTALQCVEKQEAFYPAVNIRIFHGLYNDALKLRAI